MRLIDADNLKKLIIKRLEIPDERYLFATEKTLYKEIDNAPTVDAVPVVRCKDCRFFHKYGFKLEYTECTHFDCDVTENGYCWWGERRENETN